MINRHVKTYRATRTVRAQSPYTPVGLKRHTHGEPGEPHVLLAGIPEDLRSQPVYDDLLQTLTPAAAARFAYHCEACLWGLQRLTEQVTK